MQRTTACLACALAIGCTSRITFDDTEGSGGTSGSGTDTPEVTSSGPGPTTVGTTAASSDTTPTSSGTTGTTGGPEYAPQLAILFVLDNSGSMREEQEVLTRSIEPFIDQLADVDFRIAVTTTDGGNPWCTTTSPEAGVMVLSSCRQRLQDFTFQGQTEISAEDVCTDACDEAVHAALVQSDGPYPTVPSPTETQPQLVSRPWVEQVGGQSNLPDGVSIAEALGCLLPQGINGCGFEQPLESGWKALERASRFDESNYGFEFLHGLTAIIYVSDEADCSYNPAFDTIFLPEGNRVFWSEPDAAAPTSAMCWNAGVACSGVGTYDECHAVMLDELANEVPEFEAEASAVLRPIARYRDQLLERGGRAYGILGVPAGFPETPIVYRDVPEGTPNDPYYQINFGIGPGCTSSVAEAVPPVRTREVVESFTATGLYSICATDYSFALREIASELVQAVGG